MDKIDKKIIFELQKKGRLSNFQIADKVGLSPSPCLRRIKNLEKKGVISGYTAIVNEELFGLPIIAFVFVRLENQTDATLKTFEQGINLLSQVVDCWLVTGNRDYLLRVVSQSLKTYEKYMREELTKIKGIGSWTAKMFRMFVLFRENVFSSKDLAIINSIKQNYKFKEVDGVILDKLTTKWSPYNTIASLLLWKSIEEKIFYL